MTEELERQVIGLVALDRIYVPMSSFDGKLKRRRPKVAGAIVADDDFSKAFEGDRAYARVTVENKTKSRDMRTGVEEFCAEYPQYGKILNGYIEQERVKRETHLSFGMQPGKRLTQGDYMDVMIDMGLTEQRAAEFYPVVMEISRNLAKKRDEGDRSVLIG